MIMALIGAYQSIPNEISTGESSKTQIKEICKKHFREEEYTSMIKSNFLNTITAILND